MNYPEALAWLYSAQQFGIKLGLENTRRLLEATGNPDAGGKFFHVAGTNGKGSVCAMLDAMLRAGGRRTGLFTSPHLVNFRERIRVDGKMIPEADAARILTRLKEAAAGWPHAPTFFELATVLALSHFADRRCDVVVLETGMGGRLDSTNIVTPLVAVITPIAMDHSQWLGDTLEKIAGEKAGIIKPGVPTVSAPQEPAAAAVLRARGPVAFVDAALPDAAPLGLHGRHQRRNAALALAALDASPIEVSAEARTRGLADVRWPGRFQVAENFVLDGGHNPHGAAQLAQTWRETYGADRPIVIFGVLRDKGYAEMLAALADIAAEFWFVPVDSPRSETPENLAVLIPGSRMFPTLPDALAAARSRSSSRFLLTGSLFLVGEALEVLGRHPGPPRSANE